MNERFVRQIGWLLFGLCLILGSAGSALTFINETSIFSQAPPILVDILLTVAIGVWPFVGALLISRMPTNPIGWLFSIISLLIFIDDFAFGYAYYGYISHPGSLPGIEIMIIWLYWTAQPFAVFSITLLFVLYPTGRPLSPRWGRLIWISAGAVVIYVLAAAVAPNPLFTSPFPTNLLGIDTSISAVIEPLTVLAYFVVMLGLFAAIISLFVRLSRSRGVERQQIKWFVFAAAFFIPGLILTVSGFSLDTPIAPLLFITGALIMLVSMAGIPIAATIAILRYRLWDIDIIIRRTLVYGLLTGTLAIIYFSIVIMLQQIVQQFTGEQSPLVIVLSTLIIAVLFSPLRRWIQEFIDRRFYRRHYDAVEILSRFALKVQDEVDIEPLVDDMLILVERTLNPESLSLWLKED